MLQNPFGDAKPREAIIASRVGKTEEEILKEEVKKEKLHVRQLAGPTCLLAWPTLIPPVTTQLLLSTLSLGLWCPYTRSHCPASNLNHRR